jgi:hypothetical protein
MHLMRSDVRDSTHPVSDDDFIPTDYKLAPISAVSNFVQTPASDRLSLTKAIH